MISIHMYNIFMSYSRNWYLFETKLEYLSKLQKLHNILGEEGTVIFSVIYFIFKNDY